MLNENLISKDERTNATIAHASIVLGIFSRGMLGIVLAFLIWVTQRGKSNFAARQALQAMVYQLLGIVVAIVMWFGWGITFAGSIFVPLILNPNDPQPMMPFTMIPAMISIIIPFAVMMLWTIYGLYAAWQVWHGKDFSYLLIGKAIK